MMEVEVVRCYYCLSMVFWVLSTAKNVTIHQSSNNMLACPGSIVNLNCSVEPNQFGIHWNIWCKCNLDSNGPCSETCPHIVANVVSTGDDQHNGALCAGTTQNFTYENSFVTIMDQGGISVVPFSFLSIAIPVDFKWQRLCLECDSAENRVNIHVPGLPNPPENFTFNPNYASVNESEYIEVMLIWTSEMELEDTDIVDYTIVIFDNISFVTNHTLNTSNFMVVLQFNTVYSIILYSSICGRMSDPLFINITIPEDSSPPAPPGVMITITINGSLLSFQCEEGLVTEGRLEAQCGPGRWIPDPTLHMCVNASTETGTVSTTCQPDHPCISTVLSAVISVSAVLMALFLNVIAFILGMLVGVCRRKTRQQASTTVSAAQSEGASADMSETTTGVELERVHDYEDIVLTETKDMDTITTNIAYGYAN